MPQFLVFSVVWTFQWMFTMFTILDKHVANTGYICDLLLKTNYSWWFVIKLRIKQIITWGWGCEWKSQGISKVFTIYPEGNMNSYIRYHGNPFHREISFKSTKMNVMAVPEVQSVWLNQKSVQYIVWALWIFVPSYVASKTLHFIVWEPWMCKMPCQAIK